MDNVAVQAAVDWAKTQGSTWPKDFSNQLRVFGRQLGPMPAEHGDPNGIVIRNGYVVAEFGDTTRIDRAFVVAEYRQYDLARSLKGQLWRPGCREQYDLDRSRS